MSNIAEQLKKHLAETPKEQLVKEWEALKKWNDVGPTVKEYIQSLKDMAKENIKYCNKELKRIEPHKDVNIKRYNAVLRTKKYWENYLKDIENM